jgi:tetratricopeptide (TPR) repeat protein
MECSRQLDTAGRAPAGRPLIRCLAIILLMGCVSLPGRGQEPDHIPTIKQLFAEERWQEIVRLADGVSTPSAELNYYYGIALAKLQRWQAARHAFLTGRRLQPYDKRFPIELAGVAFSQRRYPEAAKWLRRALQLDPTDAYANDFLASIYFLQGNLEAALKYWNRVGKPQIENVRLEPEPRVNAVLLDRAFAFSPASTLRVPDLLTTEARVRGLGIFPRYALDLTAREDGKFDVIFRATERNGWGTNKWEGLISLFRGVFQQTLHPEFFNLHRSAINLVSLVRWDAQKRRLTTSLSGPVKQDAKFRARLGLDLRNENWDIRDSFTGPAPLLGALNLRKQVVDAGITSFPSGQWSWSTGVEFSHRDYRSVFPGTALTQALLAQGYQLKHMADLNYQLWRLPENRFVTTAAVSSQIARIWSQPGHSFVKLQGSLAGHWFPQPHGDDYGIQQHIRAGKDVGQVPFDELFVLGLERDNDLWLHAHLGTRSGRKGSAPIGRSYVLFNWEMEKNIYQNGFLSLKLGPFLDTGKISDSSAALGSKKWLWDTGVQAKVRVLGVGVIISYGKDLRSGNNAFYTVVGR